MKKILMSVPTAGAMLAAATLLPFQSLRAIEPWNEDDCWVFEVKDDPYAKEAVFDLRPLLDRTAGEKGWIKLGPAGGFVRGDGSPIRFWAIGTGIHESGNLDNMDAHARHIAKRGVNMVRSHMSSLDGKTDHTNPNPALEPSDEKIDQIHKLVATMKKHGIYSTVSIYWRSDGRLFWDKERQDIYKNWWRELLTRPNPHDPKKTPLKNDPAFAILQIQNEDSMLFWTQMGTNPNDRPAEYATLNARFKEWLAKNKLPDANLNFTFWQIPDQTQEPSQELKLTMRFAAETMRAFNASIADFIHKEIKCPVLINAGNWFTANHVRLNDHERWSYAANEVTAVNRYVDLSAHVNHNGHTGWLIQNGDNFTPASCLSPEHWRSIPTGVKQTKGMPTLITESCWVYPNLYQSEGPLLIASYLSLSGVDSYYWFNAGHVRYDVGVNPWIGGIWKWDKISSPSVMGGFPAAAWMFHKGLVRRGEAAVEEKRGLAGDMWELKIPYIAEDSFFDPNREGTVRAHMDVQGGAPYGAFFVGPVRVEYGPNAAGSRMNLGNQKREDLNRGVIKSNTGELFLNAPEGVFTLNAPAAQGATGFLAKNAPITTGALEINLQNEYATVMAVGLDGRPVNQSGKVLLQITTLSRPRGWRESPASYSHDNKHYQGFRIDNVGTAPWMVQNTKGTVTIRNPRLTRATLVDPNFYAAGAVPVERKGGGLVVKLPPNAMYVVVQ